MKQEEINKNNKLIAEFMGFNPEKYWKDWVTVPKKLQKIYPKSFGVYFDCRFHSSWDWLMPVIEEIENKLLFYYAGHTLTPEDTTEWNKYKMYFQKEKDTIKLIDHPKPKLLTSSNIKMVYNYLVDFINWYNENK